MKAQQTRTYWASGKARTDGAIGIFEPTRVQFTGPVDADQGTLNDMAVRVMRDAGFEPLYAVAYPLEMRP